MKVALLRVGIDTGSGGIHGPLFRDGTFEFVPIPDRQCVEERTYANTMGRHGRNFIEYFPDRLRERMRDRPIHSDPEFDSFTYGDPGRPKAGLRHLDPGDMLIFYCGLEGWNFKADPRLYVIGYFEVCSAGKALEFRPEEQHALFSNNFHVRHSSIYEEQKERLVLVKGSPNSRLFNKAVPISSVGQDSAGKPLKVLSPEMQRVFGDFGGKISIQRSPPRWVYPEFTKGAVDFVTSLE